MYETSVKENEYCDIDFTIKISPETTLLLFIIKYLNFTYL